MPESEPTALRQQYLNLKRHHLREIVFFRLGDFYETFDEDAELVARELEIVLTSRANMYKGGERRIPMAGVPHHALENYVARLIAKNYHVAIAEQTGTEPIEGLVERKVIRVVTPGTVTEPNLLDAARNNYLAALTVSEGRAGLAYVDITTGEFAVTTFQANNPWALARHELQRLRPAELLLAEEHTAQVETNGAACTPLPAWKFDPGKMRHALLNHFGVETLVGFGIEHSPLAIAASGAILNYLKETQPSALNLLTRLSQYTLDEFMTLDPATRRNLELTETLRGGQIKGSLLGVLDATVTAMGARLMRQWVHQPLLNLALINERLDRVAAFHAQGLLRAEILAALKPLHDLERITNRILGGTANPRDLVALRETLLALPKIKDKLGKEGNAAGPLFALASHLDPCADILSLLQASLADEPPAVLGKPGLIRAGYAEELDGIINASRHAREWIASLEKVEKERT
ncbi:MAG: DNA mismatch repair protein MutS, partial [Anaerolineales bacterium]|nr:DNA mismatch repair protein MutS [Anaerolineales bacterium]